MSGLNHSPVAQRFLLVLLGSTLAPASLGAATVTTNKYQVIVPKTFAYSTTGVIRDRPGTITGPEQLTFSGVSNGSYATGSNQAIQLGQFTVHPTQTATGTDAVTTYNGTPFVIQVRAPQFDKNTKVPVLGDVLPNFGKTFHLKTQTLNSLLIRGHLDGTVNGSGASTVTATVDSTRLGTLAAAPKNTAVSYTFPVHYGDLKLPTAWTMNTTANALASTAATTTAVTTTAVTTTPTVGSTVVTSTSAQLLATPAAETISATPLAEPTPTPEPSSVLIFAAALGGFAWSRRRRQA